MTILFAKGSIKRRIATFIWNMSEFLDIPLGKKTGPKIFMIVMGANKIEKL